METRLPLTQLKANEAYELYENGKHRRYSLLFAVNGGAFAVAKFLAGDEDEKLIVLGKLTLTELALGMTAFTVVMVWDIYEFGDKMSRVCLDAFGPAGKRVLMLLGALLCAGWLRVAIR